MAWRYSVLVAIVGTSLAGGVWIGHSPISVVCQIDLRGHAQEALQRLNGHPAFKTLEGGPKVTQQPCRVRIAHTDGGALDHTFLWTALSSHQGGDRLLVKIDELSLDEAYAQALQWIVKLHFDNDTADDLENWRRKARRHPSAALQIVKRSQRPILTASIAQSSLGADLWRITLEVQP
jgi:hypothetical protein